MINLDGEASPGSMDDEKKKAIRDSRFLERVQDRGVARLKKTASFVSGSA